MWNEPKPERRVETAEKRIAVLEAETAQLRTALRKTLDTMELMIDHAYEEANRGFFNWGASNTLVSAKDAFYEAEKALTQKPK